MNLQVKIDHMSVLVNIIVIYIIIIAILYLM